MYNVQDYNVLSNNAVRPGICEGDILLTCEKHLHFTKSFGPIRLV